jgi:HK97 family phage major capsid protein
MAELTYEMLQKSLGDFKAAQDAALNEVKSIIKTDAATEGALKTLETSLEARMKTMADSYDALEKQIKGQKTLNPQEQVTFGQLMKSAFEEGKTEIEKFKSFRKGASLKLDLKAPADMTLTNNVQGGLSYFQTVIPGVRTLQNRAVHMRQIVPLGSMSGYSIVYLRELEGQGTPAPWAVPTPANNNSAHYKPQFDTEYQEVNMTAQYIAGILRISRQMLDDFSALLSYLNMRAMELYLRAEDQQILNGTGVAPQIQGILPLATPAVVTTGPNVERIIWSIAQIESLSLSADGVVVHPAAYWSIVLNKASGSGEYDLPGVVVVQNGQLYIAGVPIYKTTAMPITTYLTGDWTFGAQFFIREQPSIQLFDQDRDNVPLNLITLRIEGRAGLAVYRTEAFVTGTLENLPDFVTT